MTHRSAAATSSVPTRALARDHAQPGAHETALCNPHPCTSHGRGSCGRALATSRFRAQHLGRACGDGGLPCAHRRLLLRLALLLPLLVNPVAEQHLRTKRTRTRLKPSGICGAQHLLRGCLLVRLQLLVPVLIPLVTTALSADPSSDIVRTPYGHVRTRTDTYGHVRTRTDITTDVQADIIRTSYGHHTDIIRKKTDTTRFTPSWAGQGGRVCTYVDRQNLEANSGTAILSHNQAPAASRFRQLPARGDEIPWG